MNIEHLNHLVLTVNDIRECEFHPRALSVKKAAFVENRLALHFGTQKINLLISNGLTNNRGKFKMKRSYRVYQVDSFTRHKFRGNPAGVVPEAQGLTDDQMQDIARELNNSETVFIFPSDSADYKVQLRFFTPTKEVPTCGHATVAAHYVRAVENQLPSSTVFHKIGIGVLPVEIEKSNDDYRVVMTQGKVEFLGLIENSLKERLLAALNISADDLDPRCPIEHVSTGHSKVIIGLKSRATLNSLKPDLNALEELNKELNCGGYFIFTFDSDDTEILTHARMFAPQIGINEDPVTGNGNGSLGAYLVKNNLVKHDGKFFNFKSQQGEAIKRAGIAQVMVTIENNLPVKIQVGGEAVIIFQMEFTL